MPESNDSVLLLVGGLGLVAAFMSMRGPKDKDENSPVEPPPPSAPGSVMDFDPNKEKYEAEAKFDLWQSDPNGQVVQTIERCRKLILEISKTAFDEGNWPISERLGQRVGRMQDDLETAITAYQGRVQVLARLLDRSTKAYYTRENYETMVWQVECLQRAMKDSEAELLTLLKQKNIINNR